MTPDPATIADQWATSAGRSLDMFITGWRTIRTTNPYGSPNDEAAILAEAIRDSDSPTAVADMLAIAISRLGEQP